MFQTRQIGKDYKRHRGKRIPRERQREREKEEEEKHNSQEMALEKTDEKRRGRMEMVDACVFEEKRRSVKYREPELVTALNL